MKKIFLVIAMFFLMIPITAKAQTEDDFNELMQYDGYAKNAYENTIQLKKYLHGKYTNTKGYVHETLKEWNSRPEDIDRYKQIIQDGVFNSNISFLDGLNAILYKGLLEGYTFGAVAIDVLGDIFSGFKDDVEQDFERDITVYNPYVTFDGRGDLTAANGYTLNATQLNTNNRVISVNLQIAYSASIQKYEVYFGNRYNNFAVGKPWYFDTEEQARTFILQQDTPSKMYALLLMTTNSDVYISQQVDNQPIHIDDRIVPSSHNNYFDTFNNNTTNYTINNETYKDLVSIKMYCDNTIYDLTYSNKNFYYLDTVLIVDKATMQTNYEGQPCTIGFVKNEIDYVGEKVVIKTSDGTIDTETNEKISENGEIVIPECDGVLCWLTSIFKTIAGIPLALLDGLIELLKTLFVPSADSFNGFINELNTTMSEKFNLTAFTSVFNQMTPSSNARSVSPATSNAFDGVTVSGLMGTGEVKIIDSTTINAMLPTIHSWIKGFFYVLLAFFNINHFYKLIRGTTIFESMRGKSE